MVSNATLLTEAVSTLRERTGDPGETTEVDVRTGETDGATEAVAVAVLATVTEGDAATVGETVATGVAVTVIVADGITDATPVACGVLVPTGTCAVAGNAPPWRMTATADRDASRTGTIRFMVRRCGIASSSFCDLAATSLTPASGCLGSWDMARDAPSTATRGAKVQALRVKKLKNIGAGNKLVRAQERGVEVRRRALGPTLLRRQGAALRCPWCGRPGMRSVNTRRCSWWITRRAWARIRRAWVRIRACTTMEPST
jgi:hypothetical protein